MKKYGDFTEPQITDYPEPKETYERPERDEDDLRDEQWEMELKVMEMFAHLGGRTINGK